jgi:hypothetical protein
LSGDGESLLSSFFTPQREKGETGPLGQVAVAEAAGGTSVPAELAETDSVPKAKVTNTSGTAITQIDRATIVPR